VLAVLAAALLVAACGGDDKKDEVKVDDPNADNPRFHVAASASQFGGPTPLKVRFFSTPYHEKGTVRWRWRFDDGTTSEEQNPVHTFPRPGYYQVLMEARDTKGRDAWNLIVGAWPPEVWEARQKVSGASAAAAIRKIQRAQSKLTGKRRREQLAKTRKRAAQYSSGPERPKL
jgi:PKD domain-containing protein